MSKTKSNSAAQRRNRHAPQTPEGVRARRMNAAGSLATDLSNYRQSGGMDLPPYLVDILDLAAAEIERRASLNLAGWIARFAWEVTRTKARSRKYISGNARLRRLVHLVRDYRRLHHATFLPRAYGGQIRSDDPAAVAADPWPEDEDEIVRDLERIAGLRSARRKAERREDAGRRQGVPRTPERQAIEAYNVLARGSGAGIQPNPGPASKVPELIRAERAQKMPDGTEREYRLLDD